MLPTRTAAPDLRPTGGRFFDELSIGDVVREAPGVTLTDGLAALHQAIVGDRLAIALDAELSRQVLGGEGRLAHPALVWDVAIGQSTLLTQRVRANLFYRGLAFRRLPRIGDTLRTTTEVVALRQNRARAGRAATGLAVLRVRTVDQAGRNVLDFWRCAMLPLRDRDGQTEHADDIEAIPTEVDAAALPAEMSAWRLERFRSAIAGPRVTDLREGTIWRVEGGDVVSAAPELARLTLNVAITHHDAHAAGSGRRLVYGGHTIGIAAAQAARVLPSLVTILAWHRCEHLAPVYEGDTLRSELELERVEPDGGLVHLRSRVRASSPERHSAAVLDWRFLAVMA